MTWFTNRLEWPQWLKTEIKTNTWHEMTHIDMYWHILIHTDIYWHLLTCTDTYWHILTRTDTYWHLLTYTVNLSLLQDNIRKMASTTTTKSETKKRSCYERLINTIYLNRVFIISPTILQWWMGVSANSQIALNTHCFPGNPPLSSAFSIF